MRIISSYHDFYDSVQATGQDRSLVYLRETKTTPIEGKLPFPTCKAGGRIFVVTDLNVRDCIVGFCGKIYGVVKLNKYRPGQEEINKICYKIEDVDDFIHKNFKDKKIIDIYENKSRQNYRYISRSNWSSTHIRKNFIEYFQKCTEDRDKHQQLFLDNHSPIFVAELKNRNDRLITYNARLKDLEFYRLFDPFQAFQEISMYLGGLAQPDKNIPNIPDIIMVGAKGFNKFSFRKDKKC